MRFVVALSWPASPPAHGGRAIPNRAVRIVVPAASLGVEPVPGKPADFRKFVASELKAYGEMVRLAGVKPE